MNKLLKISLIIGVSAISLQAKAADVFAPVQSAAPAFDNVYDWTGLYMGGSIGYGASKSNYQDDWTESYLAEFGWSDWMEQYLFASEGNGVTFSGHVGYNAQHESGIVGGIEAELMYDGNETTNAYWSDYWGETVFDRSNLHGSVRARLGYAIDRFLPYLTAGFAITNHESGLPDVSTDSNVMFGWTAGAGVEYAIDDSWSARLEYRYTDYGLAHDMESYYDSDRVALTRHDVKLGLSFKF